jgi:hypothetical protein
VSWFDEFRQGWRGAGRPAPEPPPRNGAEDYRQTPYENGPQGNGEPNGGYDHDRLWEAALREREALRAHIADLEARLRQQSSTAHYAGTIAALEAELAECKSIIAGMLAEQTALTDQLADCRHKGRRVVGERDTLEQILRFPGVRNALLKALHPDAHPEANESERRARGDMFKTMMAVFERFERG